MEIYEYSNPELAQKKAIKYLGKDAKLYLSSKKGKKYDIFDPINQKVVSFGQLGFQDHTKHQDDIRRQRYLARGNKNER